ncbi:GNAT family N-acetyltransferase [Streptomyces blastmyceticus]|uniref:N-acetyltransferase domain-containing protein n=1 Tax=Streptomyces blastmyceticus TaxID=68180 RepID=A0ABP3GIP7_9ACTN
MALGPGTPTPIVDELPAGASVRILGPDDPVLPSALAAARLAFTEPGTGVGSAGVAELAEAVHAQAGDGTVDLVVARMGAGLTSVAAAVDDGVALCAGQHQPVGIVSEVVGVGTLPAARRRGLGLAVTAALVADARSRGMETVFLSAGDDDVARIYARLGFRRAATALIAEPAG